MKIIKNNIMLIAFIGLLSAGCNKNASKKIIRESDLIDTDFNLEDFKDYNELCEQKGFESKFLNFKDWLYFGTSIFGEKSKREHIQRRVEYNQKLVRHKKNKESLKILKKIYMVLSEMKKIRHIFIYLNK